VYIKLIDDTFHTSIASLLDLLANDCNERWGFNYELRSKIKQFYSNVHATVLFDLYLSHLLTGKELKELQDILFRLRDSNPITVYKKHDEDKYVWDVIEGPSTFSTSLACYALLLTDDDRRHEIGHSIKWLLNQRNNNRIWPTFIKGGSDNYVTTFYTILALKLWWKSSSKKDQEDINIVFQEVCDYIEDSFVSEDGYFFVAKYNSNDMCLSNTIVSLHILRLVGSKMFSELFNGAKPAIDQLILGGDNWYISELSDVRESNRIKIMYTYNPAYLISLLQLGWNVTDRTILKMLFWVVSDLKNFWLRRNIFYPWRSSDSVIQSFICSLSIRSVCFWTGIFLKTNVKNIEAKLEELISGKDVFLCHASEDKEEYVKPLYDKLVNSGISVWYDEGEILWGDKITTKIEEGIRNSKLAIICLSDNFLKKEWPDSEFSSLFSRQQIEKRKIILPLILNSERRVLEKYQLLRGISYKKWNKDNIQTFISEIMKML